MKECRISDASRPAEHPGAYDWHAENEHITAARQAGEALGAPQPSNVMGAALRTLAATLQATHAVEVGTGTGVTGLWLFQGMSPDGVLTSIDRNSDFQRAARDAFADAGISASRARLIAGEPHDVLTRLTDEAYDLVVLSGDASEFPGFWAEATGLVRPGGAVVFRGATPAALTQLAVDVRESENWLTSVLPVDGGLLVAVRQA